MFSLIILRRIDFSFLWIIAGSLLILPFSVIIDIRFTKFGRINRNLMRFDNSELVRIYTLVNGAIIFAFPLGFFLGEIIFSSPVFHVVPSYFILIVGAAISSSLVFLCVTRAVLGKFIRSLLVMITTTTLLLIASSII